MFDRLAFWLGIFDSSDDSTYSQSRNRFVFHRSLLSKNATIRWRMEGETDKLRDVDEGRKRVLLIAASILAARKLVQWDGRQSPASESAIADAIALAERIMSKIDGRWPVK
jgi:hypothetical protein